MSEQAPEFGGEQQQSQQNEGDTKAGYTPPASQEEFNRIINDRVKRERAKFADHDDLKAKAARLDEIEKANQTDAEKVAERLAAADAAVAGVPGLVASQLRTHLIGMHAIPDEDAELFLTASEPELLLKQVDRLVARQKQQEKDGKKQGNFVPREGNTSTVVDSDERATARRVFGGD